MFSKQEERQLIKTVVAEKNEQLVVSPKPKELSQISSSNYYSFPLSEGISLKNRDILRNGISEGGRNVGLAAFIRDAIGVERWCQSTGTPYTETAKELLLFANSHCSPPLEDWEINKIWESAEKDNPTPCLSDEYLQNCIDAYRKKQNKPSKIINRPLESKGRTAMLVKEEQAVEQISLAEYFQEPTPREDYDPKKHGGLPLALKDKKITGIYIYKSHNGTEEKIRYEYFIDTSKPLSEKDKKRLATGKTYNKTCLYRHKKPDGSWDYTQGNWPLYRWEEQKPFIKPGDSVLLVEGEGNVDAFNAQNKACLYPRDWSEEQLKKSGLIDWAKENRLTFILITDNDDVGRKNVKKASQAFKNHGITFIVSDMADLGWLDAPEGADGKDLIHKIYTELTDANMSYPYDPQIQEELIFLLQAAIRQKRAEMALSFVEAEQIQKEKEKQPKNNINLIVEQELFGGHWISANDQLYEYVGTHYEERDIRVQKRRIANFLKSYEVEVKGVITYPYAKTSYIEECFKWVMLTCAVPSGQLNPPGINCTNTIIRINWTGKTPSFEQIPHSPEQYYTYPPSFPYQSEADPTDCHKLLSALDPEQREILLRTIAASLDLPYVRKYKGRLVKALICIGDGSNGKDTIRELVALLHGEGLTAVTLSDFSAYDRGRKFPLSRLENSRCNWASENIQHGKLDNCQSLKAAITGDKLSSEPKGVNEKEFTPKGVFIFNCNDLPPIGGNSEAFLSRYTIIKFTKTYKHNANTAAGELEADPRYKYDPDFLKTKVMPSFLNIILDCLVKLMEEGVDYRCTTLAMEEARAENNHLCQAFKDIGLVAAKGEEVLCSEVYDKLQTWYVQNGYAEEEEDKKGKKKLVFANDFSYHDKPIKTPAKLLSGLKSVFGNNLKTRQGHARSTYIIGLTFTRPPETNSTTAIIEQSIPSGRLCLHQNISEVLQEKASNPVQSIHHSIHHEENQFTIAPSKSTNHEDSSDLSQNKKSIHHEENQFTVVQEEALQDNDSSKIYQNQSALSRQPEIGALVEVISGIQLSQYKGQKLTVIGFYGNDFLVCETSSRTKTGPIPMKAVRIV